MSESIKESQKIVGIVETVETKTMPVFNEKGEVVNSDIKRKDVIQNTILYDGRTIIRQLMDGSGNTLDPITNFAIGDGAYLPDPIDPVNPPNHSEPTDVGLNNQILSKTFNLVTSPSSVSSLFVTVLEPGEATGNWNEIMLSTSSGKSFSRVTLQNKVKSPDSFLTFRWVIIF